MATLGEEPIIIGGKKKPRNKKKVGAKKEEPKLNTEEQEVKETLETSTEEKPHSETTNQEVGDDGDDGDEPGEGAGAGAGESKKKKKKKKKKAVADEGEKKSAVGKLAAEAIKRKREEEERLRKEEEERLKREEEERIRQEEEEARLEEQRRIKKEQKKARQKELEVERKKKEDEERRLRILEQLGTNTNIVGGVPPTAKDGPKPVQKKKPIYTNKKKKFQQNKLNNNNENNNQSITSSTDESLSSSTGDKVEETNEEDKETETIDEEKKETDISDGVQEEKEDDDWETNWEDEIDEEKKKAKELEEKKKQEEKRRQLEAKKKKEKEEKERKEKEEKERIEKERKEREEREKKAKEEEMKKELRSPICCILGHVDTGKTKLLDKIRRTNVQEGEAGGITQQIGATYFPFETIRDQTAKLQGRFTMEIKVPGLLIIDTPGHESFTNLRSRGSSLCDIAILVIDIMHGLEPQTIESINLLRKRQTPFVVALNKIDRLYNWKATPGAPVHEALKNQGKDVLMEYEGRVKRTITNLAEQGLNACLYYENNDFRKTVSLVPTSAITGEGIPDLLMLVVELTQKLMNKRLVYISSLQCTVLEVKVIEGFGTTIDVVLVNGVIHEGDTIVLAGMNGPIVTTIRALLTPQPLKELRIKGQYVHHKEVKAALGLKIAAPDLGDAVAGSSLYVVGPDDDVDDIKEEAQSEIESILKSTDKSGIGVYVQASTLGSLEALLEFLKESKIPVSNIGLGPVHKKNVISASVMIERKHPELALILAFDVKITKEAQELAEDLGVRIFTADIIYHLFDQFTAHMKGVKEEAQNKSEAVFPCILEILPESIFNKRSPIIVGVKVNEGSLRVKTPLAVILDKGQVLELGRVASLENNNKPVEVAKKGDMVAVRIDPKPGEQIYMYGRHFDFKNNLCSRITRESLDAIKTHFASQVSQEDVALLAQLKKSFKID